MDLRPYISSIFSLTKDKERTHRRALKSFTWQRRAAFYSHMATQIENGISVDNALVSFIPRLNRDGSKKALRVKTIVQSMIYGMKDGYSFADSARRWVPAEEASLISSGEISGRLHESLELIIEVQELVKRVKDASLSAMIHPSIYTILVFLFLWMIGAMVVPDLVQSLPKNKASGSVLLLYMLGDFATSFWALIPVVLIGAGYSAIRYALPRWGGKNRIRAERHLPFSFYRDVNGFGWLMSFAALLRAGVTDVKILEYQLTGASPWLTERLRGYYQLMQGGQSVPEALLHSTKNRPAFGFPNPDIVDDIASFDGFPDFPEKIMRRARKWAVTLEDDTRAFAKKAGFSAELVLYAVMFYLVYASNELSTQVSNLPGMR